jgi:hypothetical protein
LFLIGFKSKSPLNDMAGDSVRPPPMNPSFAAPQTPVPMAHAPMTPMANAQSHPVPMANAQNYPVPMANAQNYPVPMANAQNYPIPMAQPVPNYPGPQASAGGYGVRYAVQPQSYIPQPMPYGPNAMMPYTETVTVSQPYCGPITWVIGLVICFFTGCGCIVACCPCDVETRTYTQETRPHH